MAEKRTLLGDILDTFNPFGGRFSPQQNAAQNASLDAHIKALQSNNAQQAQQAQQKSSLAPAQVAASNTTTTQSKTSVPSANIKPATNTSTPITPPTDISTYRNPNANFFNTPNVVGTPVTTAKATTEKPI